MKPCKRRTCKVALEAQVNYTVRAQLRINQLTQEVTELKKKHELDKEDRIARREVLRAIGQITDAAAHALMSERNQL